MITEDIIRPRSFRGRIRAALAQAAVRADLRLCVCGCTRATHRHNNRARYCGQCGDHCRDWLPADAGWWWVLTGR